MLRISHDVGVINATVDTVAVRYAGQLMEVAPRSTFFSAPAHPYSRALIASVPHLSGTKGRITGIPGSLPDLQAPPPGCRFAGRWPYAFSRCHVETPQLLSHGQGPERAVACHLFDGDGEAMR